MHRQLNTRLNRLDSDILDTVAFFNHLKAGKCASRIIEGLLDEPEPSIEIIEYPEAIRQVNFRLADDWFDVLRERGDQVGLEPGPYARTILVDRLGKMCMEDERIMQLVGIRQRHRAGKP